MSICYPSTTDWSSAFTEVEMAEKRSTPEGLHEVRLAEMRAWYALASLTAYRIGVCPDVVLPCAARFAPPGTWMAAPASGGGNANALPLRTIGALNVTPYVTGGVWVNACGHGSHVGVCGCGNLSEIYLPGPVGSIEYVKIGAETIDPSRYRVDNGGILVAVDPDLTWPTNPDMAAAPGQPGSFIVSYYRGAAPNELTNAAAGMLAIQFYKARQSPATCRLPRRVTKIARRGVEYEIGEGLFAEGITNIDEVDLVIRMFNPNLVKQASRVINPGAGRPVRRPTWGNW